MGIISKCMREDANTIIQKTITDGPTDATGTNVNDVTVLLCR